LRYDLSQGIKLDANGLLRKWGEQESEREEAKYLSNAASTSYSGVFAAEVAPQSSYKWGQTNPFPIPEYREKYILNSQTLQVLQKGEAISVAKSNTLNVPGMRS
jgi:hypothetical protein